MKLNLQMATTCFLFITLTFQARAQTGNSGQTKPVLFDGVLVAGYVDHGAFINCAGPGVKFSKKPFSLLLGLLPGLRIKEDKVAPGSTKNSTITPSLGFGLTAAYKHLAIQVPFYYNAKTSAKDGKWHPGAGLGYKF
jgi:hypothetical protein